MFRHGLLGLDTVDKRRFFMGSSIEIVFWETVDVPIRLFYMNIITYQNENKDRFLTASPN